MADNKENLQQPEVIKAVQTSLLSYYDQQKQILYKRYQMQNKFAKKGQILFVGSSTIEYFPITELQYSLDLTKVIYNRGVGASTSVELLKNIETCIFELAPATIFFTIGSNDIALPGYQQNELVERISLILDQIKTRLPETDVYVLEYFPINPVADFGLAKVQHDTMFNHRTKETFKALNQAVKQVTQEHAYTYLAVNAGLLGADGYLKPELSIEGLHMWPSGYEIVFENLKPYLLDDESKPSSKN